MYFLTNQTNEDLYLETGDYSFPFEFILPKNLPSSFQHDLGKIKYSLKGVIETPGFNIYSKILSKI